MNISNNNTNSNPYARDAALSEKLRVLQGSIGGVPTGMPETRAPSPLEMIYMRMGWSGTNLRPQCDAFMVTPAQDKWFVYVVRNGDYVVIEDGDMFPSDALITKLRLIFA